MAERLRGVAERVVDRASVAAGDRVLDVACGTGNAAILAAARGAWALGIDIEPGLIAVARERALAEGLTVAWRVGDAAALPVPDGGVTVVLPVFGVMYVPDQAAAARELARVCTPEARIALAAWVPGRFMSSMGGALAPCARRPGCARGAARSARERRRVAPPGLPARGGSGRAALSGGRPYADGPIGWRTTGFRAARASSRRRTGVV